VRTGIPSTSGRRIGPATVQGWLENLQGPRGLYRILFVGVAIAVGAATAIHPAIAALTVAVAIVAIALLVIGARVTRVFLGAATVLLIGYAFFGRAFAYVGVAPLYLGELILPVALLALLRGRRLGTIQPIHVFLLAFMLLGALRTVPYLGTYGIDALRDAVTWGYGAYALAVAFLLDEDHLRAGIRIYRRLIPAFLVWVPIAAVLTTVATLPTVPGSQVPIVVFKGGDFGVHLAGVAAFIFLGLYVTGTGRRLAEPLLWILWLAAVAIAGILNRGGLVAASMSAAVVLYVRAASRWLTLIVVAFALMVPIILVDPVIKLGTGRELSVGQMIDNVTSVFGEADNPGLEGTKEFRLRWWGAIADYTVGGPFFWTGKGFGINLANDDGFQPTADRSLRAPHNGHVEILARMGVPGLILWVSLHAVYGLSLLREAVRARGRGDLFWVQVLGFVFIYWLAALVNASFDPYLQGPQGGIWFWSMFGVGLAAMRMSARRATDDGPAPAEASGAARP
jgi:O-antigen ligase